MIKDDRVRIDTGGFTIPGESGYEQLTVKLAKQWGADVIRDSDGTELSEEILEQGYEIYSTICLIRGHNEWAKENQDKLQRTFLASSPVVAEEETLRIYLLEEFYEQQFRVDASEEAFAYWQVYDRTAGKEVDRSNWRYEEKEECVIVTGIPRWHTYSVSFLAYRIWEEISMYNHVTNNWEQEHLMPIDPRYPEVQAYLCQWMKEWCEQHPLTNVVRFTSMFYNFVWIWGSSSRNRYLYTDWASYDFTVSPYALKQFEVRFGYRLTAEDFINQGKLHVTHMPANQRQRDWMEFTHEFVKDFGKQMIDLVHSYGKQAYMFYDDSWVGTEPYHDKFEEMGFDGVIKAVFSGFEARLCAGVPVKTHELRLHPYLFPVGVNGEPSFMADGNPAAEAQKYWIAIRRALLREPIDRIGLGGYLHLVERKPEFASYIEHLADEFRQIRSLHRWGKVHTLQTRVAVLHSWGKLRSWSLSGHFHETYLHDLIHINESLSGLPFNVQFIDFDDVKHGVLDQIDVVINAGRKGSSWSGGDDWKDDIVVEKLTDFVSHGGGFIGVNEPSAVDGYDRTFRMAHILGVDLDQGERVCHGRFTYEVDKEAGMIPVNASFVEKEFVYLHTPRTKVWKECNGKPVLTSCEFGSGKGIYLSGYRHTVENTRLLYELILCAHGEPLVQPYTTDNLFVECAYYRQEDRGIAAVINNSDKQQTVQIPIDGDFLVCELGPYEYQQLELGGEDREQ